MKTDLAERLEACIAIEAGIAGVYHGFARLFPEAKTLWHSLALEEESHATILVVGRRFHERGTLPDDIVPGSLLHMHETMNLVRLARREADSDNISIDEAIELGLLLERQIEESYLKDVLTIPTDSAIVAKLQKLLIDTASHHQQILQLKQERIGRARTDGKKISGQQALPPPGWSQARHELPHPDRRR